MKKADDVVAGQSTKERNIVEDDEVGDRSSSVTTKRKVERGAMNAITTTRKG